MLHDQLKNLKLPCLHDKIDLRDYIYTPAKKAVSESVDLSAGMSEPILQGKINSCTSCAISAMIEYDLRIANDPMEGAGSIKASFLPSQLFLYYNERLSEGKVDVNASVHIRDGIKSVVKTGICCYEMWPYNINKYQKKPPEIAYQTAKSCKAIQYFAMTNDVDTLKSCLEEGSPFVFCFYIPTSFTQYPGGCSETGIMIMPPPDEIRMGGHAVAAFGYDDKKQTFLIRNSWSQNWGDKGYFHMPYEYISGSFTDGTGEHHNTFSFWTISRMS
jgi:C1A family cysteine protease